MSGNVTTLLPSVTRRACPICGFILMQSSVREASASHVCPRCKARKVSEFIAVETRAKEKRRP